MARATDEGFLGRWSRLKQGENLAPAEQSEVDSLAPSSVVLPAAPAEELAAPPSLTDADMPAIDTLNEESNFAQFLSEGVSEGLRRQALRKLFQLPEFNIRDGLNDYDEDFTQFTPLGDTVTRQMKSWLKEQFEAGEDAVAGDSNETAQETGVTPQTEGQLPEEDSDLLGDADGVA